MSSLCACRSVRPASSIQVGTKLNIQLSAPRTNARDAYKRQTVDHDLDMGSPDGFRFHNLATVAYVIVYVGSQTVALYVSHAGPLPSEKGKLKPQVTARASFASHVVAGATVRKEAHDSIDVDFPNTTSGNVDYTEGKRWQSRLPENDQSLSGAAFPCM